MPEIISLLSSDDAQEILVSSPPIGLTDSNRILGTVGENAVNFSDELDFIPAAKRRRVTPPTVSPLAKTPQGAADILHSLYDVGIQDGQLDIPKATGSNAAEMDGLGLWSSSPALPTRISQFSQRKRKEQLKSRKDQDKDIFVEIPSSDDVPPPSSHLQFSSRTAALLAELDSNRVAALRSNAAGVPKTRDFSNDKPGALAFSRSNGPIIPPSSIEDFSSQPVTEPAPQSRISNPRKSRLTTPERERRAQEKAREKNELKARKAEERLAAKEAKAREKQLAADLAEVNKARHDKKISVVEMIVRCSPAVLDNGNMVKLVQNVLSQLGVDMESDETQFGFPHYSVTKNVIRWKRRHRARYDEEAGHWVPLPKLEIRDETENILCVLDATHLAQMIQHDQSQESNLATENDNSTPNANEGDEIGLDAHHATLRRLWPGCRPIYLIQGLEPFLRKHRKARNRSYQAVARAQTEGQSSAGVRGRPKSKAGSTSDLLIDEETIEGALLELQVEHGCLIHHTAASGETAEWIGNFTQHVSTLPYKRQQSAAEASFCMDVGQVKTGEDKADTFVKMLQEIVRVTLPVAYGITAQYPTVVSLVQAMRREGPLFCQDLRKCMNKNGAFTDARIGPALSRRIYKIFMGTDPESMDV